MSAWGDAADRRRAWRWLARLAVITIAAAAVWLTVRGRLPAPGAIWTILRTADALWVVAALAAQVVSQAAFALQQRHLLGAVGVSVSRIAALAITYSRSAISLALPAGSAMSAAYAVQQYRRRGAGGATAATVAVLSVVASMSGLLAVCALAFGQRPFLSWWHGASYEAIAAAVVLVTALVTAFRSRPGPSPSPEPEFPQSSALSSPQSLAGSSPQSPRQPSPQPSARSSQQSSPQHSARSSQQSSSQVEGERVEAPSALRRLGSRVHQEWTAAVTAARSIRPRDGAAAVLWSALNWAADAFCLVAAAQACGLPAGWRTVGAAYLVAQVVRQIPISPGGLGFVEASLVTALSLGASTATAAAAVLLYRIISFWLILPVGLLTYLGLRRVPARALELPIRSVLPRRARAELAESSH
ncbi:YbhN family protein [Actinoplanes sp. L3-i22]|uniref:lysylphosphatidylglycerol synthase transmembrane domain-containing protein n=1 Tax=Actinoplanes sp. L3-i22 TaxID=2836373 RepID=UPI001C78A9A7|nr:YbhN family protein [Actinoplanes sp. L3-i22]BCY11950.1 hypothetical protein L3i22_070380 [Actinoplanes sp. L3-i22]